MNQEQTIRGWQDAIQDIAQALQVFQAQLSSMDNDADFMRAYNDLVSVGGDVLDGLNVQGADLDDLREVVATRREVN